MITKAQTVTIKHPGPPLAAGLALHPAVHRRPRPGDRRRRPALLARSLGIRRNHHRLLSNPARPRPGLHLPADRRNHLPRPLHRGDRKPASFPRRSRSRRAHRIVRGFLTVVNGISGGFATWAMIHPAVAASPSVSSAFITSPSRWVARASPFPWASSWRACPSPRPSANFYQSGSSLWDCYGRRRRTERVLLPQPQTAVPDSPHALPRLYLDRRRGLSHAQRARHRTERGRCLTRHARGYGRAGCSHSRRHLRSGPGSSG